MKPTAEDITRSAFSALEARMRPEEAPATPGLSPAALRKETRSAPAHPLRGSFLPIAGAVAVGVFLAQVLTLALAAGVLYWMRQNGYDAPWPILAE